MSSGASAGDRIVRNKKLIVFNTVGSFLETAANMAIFAWLQQYLLKVIGPEEYSLLPVVTAVFAFLPLFTSILTSGIGRNIIEAYAREDDDAVTSISSTMFMLLLGLGIAIFLLGLLFAKYQDVFIAVPAGREADFRMICYLTVFSFIVSFLVTPLQVGYSIKQAFNLVQFVTFMQGLLQVALLLLFLFKFKTSIVSVVLANTLASLTGNAVNCYFSLRMVPQLRIRLSKIDLSQAREVLSFGFWNFFVLASTQLRLAVSPLFLNRFSTPMEVSCFHLGNLFHKHSENLLSMIQSPLQPLLIATHARGELAQLRGIFLRMNRVVLWVMLSFVTPLYILRSELVDLYVGNKFALTATVIGILFSAYPCVMITNNIWRLAQAIGTIRRLSIMAFFLELLNVLLHCVLIWGSGLGAVGAAIAVASTNAISLCLVYAPYATRAIGLRLADWLRESLLPGILPACVAGVFLVVVREHWAPKSLYEVALAIAAGFAVYLAAVPTCMKMEDRQDIKALWGKILSMARARRLSPMPSER